MRSTCLPEMGKFKAIIRLYDFWLIAKMLDGHFDKFHTGVGRLLSEGVGKSLPARLINNRVLIELDRHSPYIAGFGNIFHIELPFYARMRFFIQVFSCGVWAFGCGVFGRCEWSLRESIVPSKRRFQRIREAFEIL